MKKQSPDLLLLSPPQDNPRYKTSHTTIPDFRAGFVHKPNLDVRPFSPGCSCPACLHLGVFLVLLPFELTMICHLDTFTSEAEFSNREFESAAKVSCKDGLLKLLFKCGQWKITGNLMLCLNQATTHCPCLSYMYSQMVI